MNKITIDPALIEQAAESLERIDAWFKARHFVGLVPHEVSTVEALRAALAEPAVEPAIDDSTVLAACRKLKPTLFTQGLKPLETDGENWRKNMREVEATVRTALSFVNAPPPAEVPLLTPNEVALMWAGESFDTMSHEACYVRGVKRGEQEARRKAGLK